MYSNAKSGVRKLYKAELLELFSTILIAVGGGIAIIPIIGTIIGGVIVLIGSILAIISAILGMVALNKAGKDEAAFATAFKIIILQLVLSLVVGIINGILKDNALVGAIAELITQIVDVAVTYFILTGLRRIFDSIGKAEMAAKSEKVLKIYSLGITFAAICSCLVDSKVFAFQALSFVFGLVALVVSLVAYFKYLGYLKKSANEL